MLQAHGSINGLLLHTAQDASTALQEQQQAYCVIRLTAVLVLASC